MLNFGGFSQETMGDRAVSVWNSGSNWLFGPSCQFISSDLVIHSQNDSFII